MNGEYSSATIIKLPPSSHSTASSRPTHRNKNIYNDCLVLKKALELIYTKQENVSVKMIEETSKINKRTL